MGRDAGDRRVTAAQLPRVPRHRYATLLAVLAVGGLWSGLVGYLQTRGLMPAAPLLLVRGLTVLALPVLLKPKILQAIVRNPLFLWTIGYLLFSAIALLAGPQSPAGVQAFRERIVTAVFLVTMLGIALVPGVHRQIGRLMVVGGLATLLFMLVDLIRPLTFSAVYGRPAGLYINPNLTAAALTVAIITAVHVIGRRRELVFAALGIGVVATLSRGSIGALVLILPFILRSRRARLKPMLIGLGVLVLAITVTGLWEQVVRTVVESPLGSERLRAITQMDGGVLTNAFEDASTQQRATAAALAWRYFLDHPLLGAGLGATTDWTLPYSTHNIYLRHLAEHGLLGFWIYPLFVWIIARRAPRVARWPTAVAFLVMGLVSHSVLDNWPLVIFAAWCAATPPSEREPVT